MWIFRISSSIYIALALCVGASTVIAQGAGDPAAYTLGAGDKLRVQVFEEPDLSGQFEIDGSGSVSLPLIGEVAVRGLSVREAEKRIEARYLDGYLRQPRVNVEVLNYRPFYILGEVNDPGSYPYVNGMTVLNAVALAGGFTYRAREEEILLVRSSRPDQEIPVGPETIILPGDIIKVRERFF